MVFIQYSCSLHGNDTIRFQNCNGADKLDINFKRTIRVPDNGEHNFLPPDLGNLPLFKVKDYATKLPGPMVAKGGLFFPMYQKEAMWINLTSRDEFMVKIYCGGVNVVSGEHAMEDMATKLRRQTIISNGHRPQDYVVTPFQPWVDGIAASPGFVKQFVAMPLGDGYTVEAQLTGSEVVGGLQFEITPGFALYCPSSEPAPITAEHFGVTVKTSTGKTIQSFCASSEPMFNLMLRIQECEGIPPNQQRLIFNGQQAGGAVTAGKLNIVEGATIHLLLRLRGGFDGSRQFGIAAGGLIKQDIAEDNIPPEYWRQELTTVFNVQILNSAHFREVTGKAPPKTPVSAKTYAETGLPFYAFYEESSTIHGSFDEVKSIATIDGKLEKGYKYPLVHIGQNDMHENNNSQVSVKETKNCGAVADPDGILSPNGPLREFRTAYDLSKEFEKIHLASFD